MKIIYTHKPKKTLIEGNQGPIKSSRESEPVKGHAIIGYKGEHQPVSDAVFSFDKI